MGFNEEKTDRNVSRPNDSRYRLSHPFIHGNPYGVVNQLVRRRKKSDIVVCFWAE